MLPVSLMLSQQHQQGSFTCVTDQNVASSEQQILTGSLQPSLSHSFLMSAPMTMTRVSLISSFATSPLNLDCQAKATLLVLLSKYDEPHEPMGAECLHFLWTLVHHKGSDHLNSLGSG